MAKRPNGSGYIARRGKAWRVIVEVGGVRKNYTVHGAKKDAERFVREKVRELTGQEQRREDGLPVGVTFSGLLSEFERHHLPGLAPRSQTSYRESLKPLRAFFVGALRDPPLEKIRAGHIRQYLTWRRMHSPDGSERAKPLHGRTLERDRAILHKMFALADQLEYREGNPVSRVNAPKYDKRQPVILSDEQLEAVVAECDEPILRLWTLLLNETGLRSQSEALWLRWEDVDLADGWLEVVSGRNGHRTKSGKSRSVPLTPRLRTALSGHAAQFRLATYRGERSPWVFHHTTTIRSAVAGERIKGLRDEMLKAAKRAELPAGFRPHDLRHRRATTWIADEKNVHHVQEAMGHSVIQTTMLYTHLAKEHLRSLVDEPVEAAKEGAR